MSHPGRHLPSLHLLMDRRRVKALTRRLRRDVLVALARDLLARERAHLTRGKGLSQRYGTGSPDKAALLRYLERALIEEVAALLEPRLRTVINATGVVLHTNLGRAPYSTEALDEAARVAGHYVSLEVDLETGDRGSRNARIDRWLRLLTGAEAGLAVNNGAAALWLAVATLARRRRAVISRGEQVAIGGSFRMPDLLRTTGARIVEVGTTNKTNLTDYRNELREGDVVLKVHPSNYKITGFTQEVDLPRLARLCADRGAVLVFDAGSGSLYNFEQLGLSGEPPVTVAWRAGVDVVTFSGDKLLGGPQAGLIIGKAKPMASMARSPVMRALRCDKLTLASLEATLAAYAKPTRRPALPLFELLGQPASVLKTRAGQLSKALAARLPAGWSCKVMRGEGAVGGGSFAQAPLPGYEVVVSGPDDAAAEGLHDRLRRGEPSILTRIGGGAVRLDPRTVLEDQLEAIVARLPEACSGGEAASA